MPAIVFALTQSKRQLPQEKAREGLLASAAIGYLCKHNATLSGAEGGCQAEIGVASAMSAAFLAQPCIERCAFGAVKAWIAFMIATNEIASRHRVDLDTTIATMAQTGRDMSNKYKETSTGGLALNLTLC